MNLAIVQKYQHLKKQVGNRVLFTLLLTTLMIIATMFITDSWLNDITDSNQKALADYVKMSRVSQIRTQIERTESAQRGYLLSMDEAYLPLYADSKFTALNQLQQLSTRINTANIDPQEQALFHQINNDIGAKINEMDITIKLIENGRSAQALDLVHMNQGQLLQNNIRTNVQSLYSLIEQRLNRLIAQRSEKIKWARWSILLTILVLSAVILVTLNDLIKAAREKDNAKQALTQENENYQIQLAQNLRQMQTLVLDAQTKIEDSRAQLARDLHDELGSILTAIRMDLGWSIKKMQAGPARSGAKITTHTSLLGSRDFIQTSSGRRFAPLDARKLWPVDVAGKHGTRERTAQSMAIEPQSARATAGAGQRPATRGLSRRTRNVEQRE